MPSGSAEHELDLARAVLQLHRAEVETERERVAPQDVDDRLDAIEPLLGEMLIAVMKSAPRSAAAAALLAVVDRRDAHRPGA